MDAALYDSMLDSLEEFPLVKQYADRGTVILGGHPIKVDGLVTEANLARFQTKVTFGDYQYDSDPLISAQIFSSFLGGIGSFDLKEGVDDDTCWTSTLETRFAGEITLLRQTVETDAPVDVSYAYPLGDYPAVAPMFYAAFGTAVYFWDKMTSSWTHAFDLTAGPTGKPVEYLNELFIPQGLVGYAHYDKGTNIVTEDDDVSVLAFETWDNLLCALTMQGQVRFFNRSGAWEAPEDGYFLPTGEIPKNLITYRDQSGQRVLYVVTDIGLWAVDRDNDRLYKTELEFPRAPYQALGSTNWRGEGLYVSVGTGIHVYNGSTVSAMGPDGREGLPDNLRGYITDLEPEYNNLIAVIAGYTESPQQDMNEAEFMPPQYQDQDMLISQPPVQSCILRWNGQGWHTVWQSATADGIPTWARVSNADGEYRLWWGYAGKMFTQQIPIGYHNPKTGIRVGQEPFASYGDLVTGWFDADMPAFDKIASHIELNIEDVFGTGTPTGTIVWRYQTDYDPDWHVVGSGSQPGMHVMPFNAVPAVDDPTVTFSVGTPFRRIRFWMSFSRPENNVTYSPVMRDAIFKFVKTPISGLSWTFNADFSNVDGEDGPQHGIDYLNYLVKSKKFITFTHRKRTYRVRVAQVASSQRTGNDDASKMEVRVVEIVLPQPQIREESNAPTP